ncbi:MAG TPA: RDD family protein [Candidatus Corynebacterium gallistercoris]|uniref:RDD family protein n=1 Tax=Candidatus Corynebacterium gallistercoris TaxID=2838530 RepID=A0A9D1S127_9CORY|nr:RDD family protein [Candidatus Corynebacterium gallistercoris]
MSNDNPYNPSTNPHEEPTGNPSGTPSESPHGGQSSHPVYPSSSNSESPASNPYSQGGSDFGAPPQGNAGTNSGSSFSDGTSSYPSYNSYGAYPAPTGEQLAGSGYTSLGKRFFGYLIDTILFFIVGSVLFFLIAGDDFSAWLQEVSNTPQGQELPEMPLDSIGTVSIIMFFLWFAYRVGMEVKFGGSLGHLLLSNRVVNQAGRNPDFVESLKRNGWYALVTIAGFVPLIGTFAAIGIYIFLAVTISKSPLNQSFTDKFAQTVVLDK